MNSDDRRTQWIVIALGLSLVVALGLSLVVAWLLDILFGDFIPPRHRLWANVLSTVVSLLIWIKFMQYQEILFANMKPPPEVPRGQSYVVDTSTLIDGRIADVAATGVLSGWLIVPPYVVAELQSLADSADKQRRARGRRGLDVLQRLKSQSGVQLTVDAVELPEWAAEPVDRKLVLLAKRLGAALVTHDYNLVQIAKAHGVAVVNLNDLAKALRPVCLPGERLTLLLAKPGEQPGQAVGYLDDGTMTVVEGGREFVGRQAVVCVTGVTQNSAGRMVFGRFEQTVDDGPGPA